MIKKTLLLAMLIAGASLVNAQDKYFTKTGRISFHSKASMEDIEARNKTVAAVLDTKSGATQFSVLMKGFEFEKALMQEHFNENYVESDKFPKADFKGMITNNTSINYFKDGSYSTVVKGKLTIHGVTREVEAPGTIKIEAGKIAATSTFNVLLSDYNISIPSIVKDKISNSIKIIVDCKMDPLK
jgi:polyisoprenoid-binding protein YceI